MQVKFDLHSPADYALFLKVKSLPKFKIQGRTASFPDEYASLLDLEHTERPSVLSYTPSSYLFDYQGGVSRIAIRKQKFAVFMACGRGKTAILCEFARHAARVSPLGQCVLIVSPPMVIKQTLKEAARFYGNSLPIVQVRASKLKEWLASGTDRIGITNYESLTDDIEPGRLGALIPDESSVMKSAYGAWGQRLIYLGKGLHWKLCLTGTPAPNDRIEYANHAVFLDRFPTVNSFLARYFVNRGQTDNRWELKPHALQPFYTSLSDWCIFIDNPAVYGWKDQTDAIPPIEVHIEDVPLTDEQMALVSQAGGDMFGTPGGITSRSRLSQLAKGRVRAERVLDKEGVPIGTPKHEYTNVPTNKPAFIRNLVSTWEGSESTIIWCKYNAEQESIARVFPEAASMTGATPEEERERMIEDFQSGKIPVLISKSKLIGFGLNLQIATRQVHSGLEDSYEEFHQRVKRSNRIGSTKPLNVHIPVTSIERPMVENVLRKARMVQTDTEQQERIFKANGWQYLTAGGQA